MYLHETLLIKLESSSKIGQIRSPMYYYISSMKKKRTLENIT